MVDDAQSLPCKGGGDVDTAIRSQQTVRKGKRYAIGGGYPHGIYELQPRGKVIQAVL